MSNINLKPRKKSYFLHLAFFLIACFFWAQCASLWHSVDHDHHHHAEYCDSLLAAHAQPLATTTHIPLFIPSIINHNTPIRLAVPAISSPTNWRHLARAPPALMSIFFR
jgi:hypothetical protein